MAELAAELGPGGEPAEVGPGRDRVFAGMLSAEQEELVAALIEALRLVVGAAAAAHPEATPPPPSAIAGALGGAEMVMRAELVARHPERLDELLPAFAYLVTLPYAGQKEALRLSGRARELLGEDGRRGKRP
jgi:hypothetical protein